MPHCKNSVFIGSPWTSVDLRIEMIMPSFSALLWSSIWELSCKNRPTLKAVGGDKHHKKSIFFNRKLFLGRWSAERRFIRQRTERSIFTKILIEKIREVFQIEKIHSQTHSEKAHTLRIDRTTQCNVPRGFEEIT
jgi:hypothetical protein